VIDVHSGAIMRALLVVPALLLGCVGCATPDAYPRHPTAQEIATVEGVYGLSDGFRAHLYGLDDRLYVRIGAGSEKMLRAVGPGRYASRNGDVSIQFQPPDAGYDADRVEVAYYRKPGARPPIMFSTGLRPGRGFLD
jgi:hypothetical protein